MSNLKIINQNGKFVTDSREVAEMIGKQHKDLLRDIRNYMEILVKRNFALNEFFIESFYNDSIGRTLPHYLLTKKGCDMVANKMTGEKGILFTAVYVTKFVEMENKIYQPKSQLEILQASINQLIEQEQKVKEIEAQLTTVNHRLDNIDSIDTIGDLQQRLNAMVRRYVQQEGLTFGRGWRDFRSAYNTAYRTNLKNRITHYSEKHGFKSLTVPQYLSLINGLEDAIRVADKMLNQQK